MGKRGEKKVIVWTYKDQNVTLDIPVVMVNRDPVRSYRPDNEPNTAFRVRIDEPEIDLEDTDINRLKVAVFAEIKQKLKIEWNPMLHIVVSGSVGSLVSEDGEIEGRSSLEVNLSYQRVQIAEVNGQKISRNSSGQRRDFDIAKGRSVGPYVDCWGSASEGWPEIGEETESYKSDRAMRALIPDTQENRKSLEQIASGFDGLLVRLRDLLSPEKVEKTLASIQVVKMLSAPSVA